jgi:hypothetical protein
MMTPQYLSGLLNCLEADGLISRSKGWIVIPDRKRLFHRDADVLQSDAKV